MASHKLNLARIRGCPPPAQLAEAMEAYGLPESEEYGLLHCQATDEAVFGTLLRRSQQVIQKVDNATREVTSAAVEKVTLLPFAVVPRRELLETYAGSAWGLKELEAFLTSALSLPVVVEAVELDVLSAVEKLERGAQRFVLRSARVSDFAHNSFLIGPYAPKFADTEHGRDFLGQYAQAVKTASVRWQGPNGRVLATLTPTGCFTFSCADDDLAKVKSVLRGLA